MESSAKADKPKETPTDELNKPPDSHDHPRQPSNLATQLHNSLPQDRRKYLQPSFHSRRPMNNHSRRLPQSNSRQKGSNYHAQSQERANRYYRPWQERMEQRRAASKESTEMPLQMEAPPQRQQRRECMMAMREPMPPNFSRMYMGYGYGLKPQYRFGGYGYRGMMGGQLPMATQYRGSMGGMLNLHFQYPIMPMSRMR